MTIRVAVIGYGLAGRGIHSPLISAVDGMQVTSVVTSNPQRAQQAQSDIAGVTVFPTFDDVLEQAHDHDLVVIATTNSSHVPYALVALERGLHVVIDKPMAGTLAQAQAVFAAAEKADRTATVFHNRRWDGDFLTVKGLAETGQLGKVVTFQSGFERYRPELTGRWRETGGPEELPGLLFDLGSHLVDQAIQIWGPVVRVLAHARSVRDVTTSDDDTLILLEHGSGVTSELHATVFAAVPGPRFRVLGSAGTATIFGLDEQEGDLGKGHTPRDEHWGSTRRVVTVCGGDGQVFEHRVESGQWNVFYESVHQAITNQAAIPVSPTSVLQTVATLEAAVKSNALRAWVDVPHIN